MATAQGGSKAKELVSDTFSNLASSQVTLTVTWRKTLFCPVLQSLWSARLKNPQTLSLIHRRATPCPLHSLCGPWPQGFPGRRTALAKSSAWEVQKLLFPICIQWRQCRHWTQSGLQHFKVQETKAWKSKYSYFSNHQQMRFQLPSDKTICYHLP